MGRYVKRITKGAMSLGPTEERHAGVWNGYEIEDADGDLSAFGLVNVDALSDDEVEEKYGVTVFTQVAPDNEKVRRFLGLLQRNRQ